MRGSRSGRALIAAGLLLGILAFAAACGGGTDTSPSTPTGIETQAQPKTPDAVTTAPTLEPTAEPTEKPVIPTFEEMSASVDAAVQSFGSTTFPGSIYDINLLNEMRALCNEKGLEGVNPEIYAMSVLSGCGNVGIALIEMMEVKSTPELENALNQIRDYTLGADGKLDQLVASGKLSGIDSGSFKSTFNTNYFTKNKPSRST